MTPAARRRDTRWAGAPGPRGYGIWWARLTRTVGQGARERASATVLVVAVIGVTLVLTAAGLALASSAEAAHRARAAADLGSLAGAVAYQRGDGPAAACAAARELVTRNAGRQRSCSVGVDGSVLVTATSPSSFGLPGLPRDAVAQARAGPAP